jgi:hypothetical protein
MIRELFPDSSFKIDNSMGMELRRLQRGLNSKIDKLLDYLEVGCFEAMAKKYLKTIVLSVMVDRKDPKVQYVLIPTIVDH